MTPNYFNGAIGELMEQKIVKTHLHKGFGFPVLLKNVIMNKVQGKWCPKINQKTLSKKVWMDLATKREPFTGAEIKYIRSTMGLTMKPFAKLFEVSHVAVSKWESKGQEPAAIRKPVVRLIKLYMLREINDFTKIWQMTTVQKSSKLRFILS